ncbi:binding-protein-dependent transport systems inner membrane component [Alkaliphilus metalliredigens QYMF]|uniref:Binding-protein-dependent transport systems inner membrane component n=1 Tax=Alkaliphilus metalliredigens (strain QYMF) TaxID=293826 RepID=A6TUX4_ALKMQ|nr:methionine ABC transporter permease [Alkaliphilus metalliredigens]ABR49992.1 binding-protein-dependent transport systems inner membrane component [Alkaliphilus metalliredigens QYMF]
MELVNQMLPNVVELFPELVKAFMDTLIMVFISGLIASIIGIPLGVILVITRKGNLVENKLINFILGKVVNIFRSLPFVILLTAIIPITRFLAGTTIGLRGAIIPLIFASAPFVARQVESALLDIDPGVIEAAQAMGSSPFEIIYRVLLVEGLPGIIYALTITVVSLIGFSAIAGTVGGGGLGDFAIRYGYQYYRTDIMIVSTIILLLIVNVVQSTGEYFQKKLSH